MKTYDLGIPDFWQSRRVISSPGNLDVSPGMNVSRIGGSSASKLQLSRVAAQSNSPISINSQVRDAEEAYSKYRTQGRKPRLLMPAVAAQMVSQRQPASGKSVKHFAPPHTSSAKAPSRLFEFTGNTSSLKSSASESGITAADFESNPTKTNSAIAGSSAQLQQDHELRTLIMHIGGTF